MKLSGHDSVTFLLVLIAVSVLVFQGYLLMLRITPPMKYVSVTTQTPQVREGDRLELTFIVERSRICKTTLNRFITAEQGNEIVWRESVVGGLGGVGKVTTTGKIQLPPKLTPGKYRFETLLYADCYEGQHTASHTPVLFEVVK